MGALQEVEADCAAESKQGPGDYDPVVSRHGWEATKTSTPVGQAAGEGGKVMADAIGERDEQKVSQSLQAKGTVSH